MSVIPFLSAGLLAAWLAESLRSSDYFVFHVLLARRSAAVAGILLGVLVFRQTFCQLGDCLVLLAYLTILRFYVTVQFGNLSICRLMVSRINRISAVMSCSTFDMSVTCFFIGVKVRKISHMHKK